MGVNTAGCQAGKINSTDHTPGGVCYWGLFMPESQISGADQTLHPTNVKVSSDPTYLIITKQQYPTEFIGLFAGISHALTLLILLHPG